MRRIAAIVVSSIVAVALAAGEGREPVMAAEAGNQFAVDLYGSLSASPGNMFFSPHSIHVALAMACAGARGQTAADMQKVLHLPDTGAERAFRAFLAELNSPKTGGDERPYQLVVANSLWGQKGYPFEKEYLDVVHQEFGGELSQVDFLKETEAARKTINGWVEERTARKIVDLIPAGLLLPETRLVLTNAIYMKSAWFEEFSEKSTKEAPFHAVGGRTPKVPLMHRVGRYSYLEGDGFQAVEIPYSQHRLSMVIFLPARGIGLSGLEKKLSSKNLMSWTAGMRSRSVDLSIPRFKLTSEATMSKVLRALGMARAFTFGEADFSGMAPGNELFIGEVIHKAYIDVNEKGTEAAAATAVVMLAGAAPKRESPVVFKADRPFVFLIRDRQTGAILFLGRLVDPAAQG